MRHYLLLTPPKHIVFAATALTSLTQRTIPADLALLVSMVIKVRAYACPAISLVVLALAPPTTNAAAVRRIFSCLPVAASVLARLPIIQTLQVFARLVQVLVQPAFSLAAAPPAAVAFTFSTALVFLRVQSEPTRMWLTTLAQRVLRRSVVPVPHPLCAQRATAQPSHWMHPTQENVFVLILSTTSTKILVSLIAAIAQTLSMAIAVIVLARPAVLSVQLVALRPQLVPLVRQEKFLVRVLA